MKIRNINLPWNQITGRVRRTLVLPRRDRYDNGIPTAEVTLKVELIEEFRVLKKMMIGNEWAFIIVDKHDDVQVITFDDDGRDWDINLPEETREWLRS